MIVSCFFASVVNDDLFPCSAAISTFFVSLVSFTNPVMHRSIRFSARKAAFLASNASLLRTFASNPSCL